MRRSAVVVVAALTAGLGCAACEPRTSANPGVRIRCQVLADAPSRDNDAAPQRVVGRARFWCDPPGVTQLSLTVRLQRRNSHGTWFGVNSRTFTVRGRETVRTDTVRYRVRAVSWPCSESVFRTVVTARAVARGVTTRYEDVSAQFVHPCRPALFAR